MGSISFFWCLLVVLILISGFFSSAETGIMSLNRYRLRHRAQSGDIKAKRIESLLNRPDRLLGTILFWEIPLQISVLQLLPPFLLSIIWVKWVFYLALLS